MSSLSMLARWSASVLVTLVLDGSAAAQELHELAKLGAADRAAADDFGWAVAISGDTAIVGARRADHSGWSNAGAAYIFVRTGGDWSQEAKLTASDPAANEEFGRSVALSGDTAIVGMPVEDVWYSGELKEAAGTARVFTRSGATWTEVATLSAGVPEQGDFLGHSVALSGDVVLVSAPNDDGRGSVLVFVHDGAGWTEEARLEPSDGQPDMSFGYEVALWGDTAVVGAPGEGSPVGSAYVFVRAGTAWTEQAKLVAGAEEAGLGASVSIDGDMLLIGAPGDTPPNGVPFSGAAYIFARSGTVWSEQATLWPSEGYFLGSFGGAVALEGDTAIIGRPSNHPGGAAYVFRRDGATWTEVAQLTSGQGVGDALGRGVAMDGGIVLVGAPTDGQCAAGEGSARLFGPVPGLVRPHIDAFDPPGTPALVPGTGQTLAITGEGLDRVTSVLLECMPIDPSRYTVVSPTRITIDMPQVPHLEDTYLAVTDGSYTESATLWIEEVDPPTLQLGTGEPSNVIDVDDGVSFIVGGRVDSKQFLYFSTSAEPSSNSYVNLAIGNGFTELYRGGFFFIPRHSGWLQVDVPASALSDPGPSGTTIYAQTLEFRSPRPFRVSNVQSIVLVR